ALLGHPRVDPHGDPIPTAAGQISNPELHRLSECIPGQQLRIARIEDQEEAFLRFAADNGLTPGMRFTVRQISPDDNAITIQTDAGDHLTLPTLAASKILVA